MRTFSLRKGTLLEKPTLIKQNFILNIGKIIEIFSIDMFPLNLVLYYDFRRKNHARPQRGNESKR